MDLFLMLWISLNVISQLELSFPGGLWSSMAVLRLWSHHRDGHSAPEQRCGIGMVYILLEIWHNTTCWNQGWLWSWGIRQAYFGWLKLIDTLEFIHSYSSCIKKNYSQLTCFAPSTLRLFGWCAGRRLFRWGSFVTHVAGRCFLELLSRLCPSKRTQSNGGNDVCF